MRLKDIAARVEDEFGGDLRAGLVGPIPEMRKALKKFPNIADPGADRILLFAGVAPVAAVPSNCPHVVVRVQHGKESQNYGVTYREAQQAIEAEVPGKIDARARAYLLLKRHGQDLCKRTKPKCWQCPVSSSCAFFAAVGLRDPSTARIDSRPISGQNAETPLKDISSSGAMNTDLWAWVELNYRPHAHQATEGE